MATISARCKYCDKEKTFEVNEEEMENFLNSGASIETCFPKLTADEVRFLEHGICDECVIGSAVKDIKKYFPEHLTNEDIYDMIRVQLNKAVR